MVYCKDHSCTTHRDNLCKIYSSVIDSCATSSQHIPNNSYLLSLLSLNSYFMKSNTFVLMLDASKASHRVNCCKLFRKLLKPELSPLVLRLLFFYAYKPDIKS